MINDAINERIFEFALDCQRLIEKGWKFEKINYGEARLGIGPSLIVSKNGIMKTLYHPDDIASLFIEEITPSNER